MLLDTTSLTVTLDRVNDHLFWGNEITPADREAVIEWIIGRQGLPHSYAGMFAPTELDFQRPLHMFTGERMESYAGRSHILGEEASVVLAKLGDGDSAVAESLSKAGKGLLGAIDRWYSERPDAVEQFCCGTCTPAFWRNLHAGGLGRREEWLAQGIKHLTQLRKPDHQWRRFPLYWTVYSLLDIDLPEVRHELEWVAPKLERTLKRKNQDIYAERRMAVAERALAKI